MVSPNEASWKLAEYERHFNIIQAGLRGIASIWLLAAFGAIASVLAHQSALTVPSEVAIAAICAMGSTGLALLWAQDALIYHKLLNAIFLVGLRIEHSNRRLPPIHAAMFASMPRRGYEYRLSAFYAVPIGALGVASVSATAAAVVTMIRESEPVWNVADAVLLTAVPFVLLDHVLAKSDDEKQFFVGESQRYENREFCRLLLPPSSEPNDRPPSSEPNDRRIDRIFARYHSSVPEHVPSGVDPILAAYRPEGEFTPRRRPSA